MGEEDVFWRSANQRAKNWAARAGRPSKTPWSIAIVTLFTIGFRQRQQILGEIGLFSRGQSQAKAAVIVIDDVVDRGEPPVVIKAAFGVRP